MLNWFILQVQQFTNSSFQIQAPLSNANFPFFCFEISGTAHLQPALYYIHISALHSAIFFMLFYIKFNFGFNVWLQGTSLHNVPMSTATPAALSALHPFRSSGFTHSLCRGSEQNAQSLQTPPQTPPHRGQTSASLPLKGLRAEREGLLMLLTYNQFSLHYFIT